jgi:DNA modification methylase
MSIVTKDSFIFKDYQNGAYGNYPIICGDCLEVMPLMEENSIDSIVTDPPYGLSFMGKDWDKGVPGVNFYVNAKDISHAVKIANEKRIGLINSGLWTTDYKQWMERSKNLKKQIEDFENREQTKEYIVESDTHES